MAKTILSDREVNQKIRNVGGTLAIEGLKLQPETIQLGRRMMKGQISRQEAIDSAVARILNKR